MVEYRLSRINGQSWRQIADDNEGGLATLPGGAPWARLTASVSTHLEKIIYALNNVSVVVLDNIYAEDCSCFSPATLFAPNKSVLGTVIVPVEIQLELPKANGA